MIYSNIKKMCDKNNISIHTLEKQIGLGNGSIKRWEKHTPNVLSVNLVAKYFKVPIEKLIGEPVSENFSPYMTEILKDLDNFNPEEIEKVKEIIKQLRLLKK